MKDVLAMVLAGGRVDELGVLTLSRPKSAVPFGGMYRVIDFSLSNLMHSGIERVGVLSQYRSYSLINHVGVGSWWDFAGRDRGATLLLPSVGHTASDWYKGGADAVYQNLEFIRDQKHEAVMVLSGDHVYEMNYSEMMKLHREKDADLTIAFAPVDPAQSRRFGVGDLDSDAGKIGGWLKDYKEKPAESKYKWASLTIYIFKTTVLAEVLEANTRIGVCQEFGRNIIPSMLGRYKIYGYKFNGYWGYTRTIDEYWRTSMDLLGNQPKIDLEAWQVRTNLDHDRLRDRQPARISARATIRNSRIHNGCLVEGHVENSILFPGTSVAPGAVVKDSILFFDAVVEDDVQVVKTIADFDVHIGSGVTVGSGEKTAAKKSAISNGTSSGITIIGKGVAIPSGVQIGANCIVAPGLGKEDFKQKTYQSGLTIS